MKDPKHNLAIFGHAKHGKSTLGGRLAFEYGAVSKNELDNFEVLARQQGKDFNKFNYVFLKRNSAVWQKDKDIEGDSSRTVFPEFSNLKISESSSLTLVDTPGHRDYISNLIYGVYLADQAIVTIAANTGIEDVTLEVFKSLLSFEIPILAIVITKMDIVNYSELIFNEIVEELDQVVNDNYKVSLQSICEHIVPVSALSDVGIINKNNLEWYEGDALNDIIINNKYNKPVDRGIARFVVEGSKDIYNIPSVGVVVVGTLENGSLKKNDKLILEPASAIKGEEVQYKIKSIQNAKSVTDKKKNQTDDQFNARSILSIVFANASFYELKKQLKRGGIFGLTKPSVANKILADIRFFEIDKVYQGMEFVLHSNASYSTVRISKFDQAKIEDYNRIIEFEIDIKSPICLESNDDNKRLGKFILRKDKTVIGCGVCKKILA